VDSFFDPSVSISTCEFLADGSIIDVATVIIALASFAGL
jgi:hypothetical protein